MPVPAKKKFKATKVAKKSSAETSKLANVKSAGTLLKPKANQKVKPTTATANGQFKKIKNKNPTETKAKKDETKKLAQHKDPKKPHGVINKNFKKNAATAKQKEHLLLKPKIHPEVEKLVQILTNTIKDLSVIKSDKNEQFDRNEETELISEPWGLQLYCSEGDSLDFDDQTETACGGDSDCSCCADNYDADFTTDNSYSCSDDDDDDDDDMSDDLSSYFDDSTDEFTTNGYDADTDHDDESCSGCNDCMPYAAGKKSRMKPDKFAAKAGFIQKTKKLQAQKNEQAKKNLNQAQQQSKKKATKNTNIPLKNSKAPNKAATSNIPKIITKNATKPKISVAVKSTVAPTAKATIDSKKFKHHNDSPKQTFHVLKPPMARLTASKSSTKASSSSGFSSWASQLMASSTTNTVATSTKAKQKIPTAGLRTCRSVGVSCHLPNANSTLRDSISHRIRR